jgi:hypothetical protein
MTLSPGLNFINGTVEIISFYDNRSKKASSLKIEMPNF